MEYKFAKIDFSYGSIPLELRTYDFGVEYDSIPEDEKHLFEIAWPDWTVEEIQMIIDKCNRLQGSEEYTYQVVGSDLMIVVDKPLGAYFFSARSEQEEADIIWSFDKFIDFMEQFKVFVEANS